MRNRLIEKLNKVDMVINLSTELIDRAVKSKTHEEFELYLKCSELLNNYAAQLMKEEHED